MPYGSLTPFAEPAFYRVSPPLPFSPSFPFPAPHFNRESLLLPLPFTLLSQDLPSPYYKESHERLRKAIREWTE